MVANRTREMRLSGMKKGGVRKRGLWTRLNGHVPRKRRNSQALAYSCARRISIPTDELIFQSQMVLDPDHPGHILRKYFERVPLGPIADAAPQIDHTAMHHDIDGGAR